SAFATISSALPAGLDNTGFTPHSRFNRAATERSEAKAYVAALGRYSEISRGVVPVSVYTAMARISRSWAAWATDSQMVSEIERWRVWRRRCRASGMFDSASRMILAMMATASRGYFPLAVSAES